ncbi:MAG: cytochrome b/b6 domain-containing protein [Pseudomonadales bacterium]
MPKTRLEPEIAQQYTRIAQWLHWLIAGLIIAQYVLAKLAENAADTDQTSMLLLLLANHKSVGMTVLVLAALRILWRLGHRPPAAPPMQAWQSWAAKGTHWLIYLLIFAIPISGWLLSSAAAYSVSWFGLFQWPDLVNPSPALKTNLNNLHHWLAEALFVLVLIHVLATAKHQWFDRDPVFARMFNGTAVTISVAAMAAAIWLLGLSVSTAVPLAHAEPPAPAVTVVTPTNPVTVAAGAPALWRVDYARSDIQFVAEQAGARFEGRWQNWQAQIRFATDQLDASTALVTIAADSAATNDADRDATMRDADWFAAAAYPEIIFAAQQFESTDPDEGAPHALLANGELRIKQIALPAAFHFSVTAAGKERYLQGTARLDRLALGLGLGEWADPDSVGQFVTVQVSLVATVP